MDFIIGFSISPNKKYDSYNLVLVIVDQLIKMVYYIPIKVIIDALGLAKVITNVVVRHHKIAKLIMTDWGSFFTSKFWSSLCYFLRIKQKLFATFHTQIDG